MSCLQSRAIRIALCTVLASWLAAHSAPATAGDQLIVAGMKHLRNGETREWNSFPETPDAAELKAVFSAKTNANEFSISLRQQDLKQSWDVQLNGKPLGRLPRDENDMVIYFPVAAKLLKDGQNELRIATNARQPDDIRVGEIRLHDRPLAAAMNEAELTIAVHDADADEQLPCRLTILNADGAMQPMGMAEGIARAGTVYCLGKSTIGLPAGKYTVYAGRGFEYSVDSLQVELSAGDKATRKMKIRREVDTAGYVACDTHVHTVTFSGHGDASIVERMYSLAGEGIELPIATDHNIHVDYEKFARPFGIREFLTPVIGNEFTTKIGHFNIFPIKAGAKVPDHRPLDWEILSRNIFDTPNVRVAILNHPRDLHSGFRPFGPKHHNALVARNLDGWTLRANAMEVVNSGAQQTDVSQLFADWIGHLNAGRMMTPVGSSDSHDVSRHFVGQGRTYIRCPDDDVSKIDVDKAIDNFLAGRVLVSCGLLVKVDVNGRYREGDLVPKSKHYQARVTVSAPSWSHPDRVKLYLNGRVIFDERIKPSKSGGVRWSQQIELPVLKHDANLVAFATGPGVRELFWASAKPYQPTSQDPSTYIVGSSGAVWIDADGDGRRTSAAAYSRQLLKQANNDAKSVLELASDYDPIVAAHIADQLLQVGKRPNDPELRSWLKGSSATVQEGFRQYREAWTQCLRARLEK